ELSDAPPPTPPAGITARAGPKPGTIDVSVTVAGADALEWGRPAAGVVGYDVHFASGAAATPPFADSATFPGPPETLRLEGLRPGTEYRLYVRTRDGAGALSD